MDILRRSVSPLASEAWDELDSQAKKVLLLNLSARRFMDVEGPKGWSYSSHPTGRLDTGVSAGGGAVKFGINRVLPLVETRVGFELDIWELDNISRGAKDPDLAPLDEAAKEIALFEERAVYGGLAEAGIVGLSSASRCSVAVASEDPRGVVNALSEAVFKLRDCAVEGPYALVASPALWKVIYGGAPGYPTSKHIANLADRLLLSTQADSYVVSLRGGDFEIIVGQDFSLGFEERAGDRVRLFLTESFTFRAINPEAAVRLVL